MTDEDQSAKNERLEEENCKLRQRVAQLESWDALERKAAVGGIRLFARLYFGPSLQTATAKLTNAVSAWQRGETKLFPSEQSIGFVEAAIRRFVRVFTWRVLFALAATLIGATFVGLQTWMLYQQNQIIGKQSDIYERQTSVMVFEQAARIRELFKQTSIPTPVPKPDAASAEKRENVQLYEPNKSSLRLVANMARAQKAPIIDALVPLLKDDDGRVSGAALLSIRDILREATAVERVELQKLLPVSQRYGRFKDRPVQLRNVSFTYEDLSDLEATGLLTNVEMTECAMESVVFPSISGSNIWKCSISGSKFDGTALIGTRFRVCNLMDVSFANCQLRETQFDLCLIWCASPFVLAIPKSPPSTFAGVDLSTAHFLACSIHGMDTSLSSVLTGKFMHCGFFFSEEIPRDWVENSTELPDNVRLLARGDYQNILAKYDKSVFDKFEAIRRTGEGLEKFFDALKVPSQQQ